MKKTFLSIILCACISFLSSCSHTIPVTATSNDIGNKIGKARSTQIAGFFFDGGDVSIQKAAAEGGLKKISTVDFKTSIGFLGLWITYTTIVTGE